MHKIKYPSSMIIVPHTHTHTHTHTQWTLMSYMIEGGGSPTLSKSKFWLYRHPEASHRLLQSITDVSVDYLVGQVEAGAQLLQVFESHAGILGPQQFGQYSLPYLKQIARRVKAKLKEKKLPDVPMVREHRDSHGHWPIYYGNTPLRDSVHVTCLRKHM